MDENMLRTGKLSESRNKACAFAMYRVQEVIKLNNKAVLCTFSGEIFQYSLMIQQSTMWWP